MSLEKLAHDSYTQGFTEALRSLNVPDSVKVASATIGRSLVLGGATGALGAEDEDDRLMGALKGSGNFLAKEVGYGFGGALGASTLAALLTRNPSLATNLGLTAGVLGGLYGGGKAMYDNYHGDYGLFGEA